MKIYSSFLLVALALVLTVSGCAQFGSGVAPSNTPLAAGSYEPIGPVSGESCATYLFGILGPLPEFNSVQAAMMDAQSKKPGTTALVGVTADTRYMNLIIVRIDCTRIEGIAVKGK